MDRLIDADELHEIINWTHMKPPFSKKAVHRFIDMARTVEAEPVRHGRWNETNFLKVRECSCCHAQWGMYSIEEFDYCPTCGAKMDGEREEE